MTSAVEQLMGMAKTPDLYDHSPGELASLHVAAMNERFQERRGDIKLLQHRAKQAGIEAVTSTADMVPLLFPHTAYKSYPESILIERQWAKLTRWMETISTYRMPELDFDEINDIDDWVNALTEHGLYVSCSSGTTGKSAMLIASERDMKWLQHEAVVSYAWGSGVVPAQDRQIFGLAPVAQVPRNVLLGNAYRDALQDPSQEPFAYPAPPITIAGLTNMVVMRKRIADGTATPEEIAELEATSKSRGEAMDAAIGIAAKAIAEARSQKLHVSGMWASLYPIAKAVREMGFSAQDFHPENSFYVGGGLKRAQLPPDYREFVWETFNIAPERNYINYSMQELQSSMPRCQAGGRYHLPPWLVPLILDKSGDALLPVSDAEYEGRAAFFDVSIDGRWGGVITGDKVSISYAPCPCGTKSATIRDDVTRYADLEGDDKIGCAGTVDAYVRGVSTP